MGYMIFEYLVCLLGVFGFATLLFVIWLVPVLAHEGLAYVSEIKRKSVSSTSQIVVGLGGLGRQPKPVIEQRVERSALEA